MFISEWRISQKISTFTFIGMSYCWDAFVSFMFKIPLSNSFFGVILKENEFPNCFAIVELLKYWDVFCIFLLFFSYSLIFSKFTAGSSNWRKLRFEMIFEKIIKKWRFRSSSIISPSSIMVYFTLVPLYLRKTVLFYSRTIYCLSRVSDSGC